MKNNYSGTATLISNDGDRAGFEYRVRQMLMRVNTCMPVVVLAVKGGGVAPVGFVDCEIAVTQITGDNTTVDNVRLNNVPYMRIQGGTDAVIIDPKVGDLGLCGFCQRDISAFKNARRKAPPNSRRILSASDAVYIGGILNGAPTQYVEFSSSGITIHSPNTVTINSNNLVLNAPTTTINSPTITLNGSITASGGVSMDGVTFGSHVHDETDSVTSAPRNP